MLFAIKSVSQAECIIEHMFEDRRRGSKDANLIVLTHSALAIIIRRCLAYFKILKHFLSSFPINLIISLLFLIVLLQLERPLCHFLFCLILWLVQTLRYFLFPLLDGMHSIRSRLPFGQSTSYPLNRFFYGILELEFIIAWDLTPGVLIVWFMLRRHSSFVPSVDWVFDFAFQSDE